jgi:D,D-heptose 1,7-bisphosphate phosphatase
MDRDGVINHDRGYVHRWEDFEFVPDVLEAAHLLASDGWTLVVVTNQSGIARGYYTEEAYQALTRNMEKVFAAHGAPISAVYHCPHFLTGRIAALAVDCDCRKPKPGLILRARDELGLCLQASVMIGDKPSDILAARNAGVGRAFLIRSELSRSPSCNVDADGVFDTMADCVNALRESRP